MGTDGRRRRSPTRWIRALPIDLLSVIAMAVLAAVLVVLSAADGAFLGVLLGIPLILFLPGYAFVSALFPEAERTGSGSGTAEQGRSRPLSRNIDDAERLTFSVGTSIVIAPLIGLALNYTPWGIDVLSVTVSVSVFTVTAASVGILRRQALPEDRRFAVLGRSTGIGSVASGSETRTRTDLVLNVAVALSALLVIGSVAYVAAVPRGGETITGFYLLTENETTGELVAEDYPTEFVRGEPKPLVVGIENHERRPVNYTVIVALQRIENRNGSTTVVEQRRLHRFQVRVGANESRLRRHTVVPPLTGERLRLTYLLYRGAAPANPTAENAYREIHLWVDVSAPRESGDIHRSA